MNPKHIFTLILLFLLVALVACTPSGNTPDNQATSIVVVPTTAAATVTTAAPITATLPATVTAAPTATTGAPIVATTPATAVPAVTTVPGACTNAAAFVADVTIPDNSQMGPGNGFVKTWRIKNTGTCTWDNRYSLVHSGGDLLGAITTSFPLVATVAPGQTVDLSVSLIAPAALGSYQSDWKLSTPQGARFGLGVSNTAMYVKIVVIGPTPIGTASINGYAWQDKDSDNVVDNGEKLANAIITLSTGNECRTTVKSVTTDASGRFSFIGLSAGNYCLSGTDGTVTVSQAMIALSNNQQLNDVAVTWPPVWGAITTIAGLAYQDVNESGSYENGEPVAANREIWLTTGNCAVASNPVAVAWSGTSGFFSLHGEFSGQYCVGIKGPDGLEDVVSVNVTSGQLLENVRLKAVVAHGSISGYLWNDYCSVHPNSDGTVTLNGHCVPSNNGGYSGDGMISPEETYIPGITIYLHAGACVNAEMSIMMQTMTDGQGRYEFTGLPGGTYCVFMNAAAPTNAPILLPGDWTFPNQGIWYQQITIQPDDDAFPVNFGWDYQLD